MTTLTGMLTDAVATPHVVVHSPRRRALTSPPPPELSQRLVLITLLVGVLVTVALVVHSPGGPPG